LYFYLLYNFVMKKYYPAPPYRKLFLKTGNIPETFRNML